MKDNVDLTVLFEVFKEIGIIEQLSRALLEARLPDGLIAPHFGVGNAIFFVLLGYSRLGNRIAGQKVL